ncbi:MAG: alpha-amylase family glycosyl hydrolase [Phototrophicales bacterium]
MHRKARKSLERLKPRFEPILEAVSQEKRDIFWQRMEAHFPRAFDRLIEVYGNYYSFFYHLEAILRTVVQAYVDRPDDLHALDAEREANPTWFQSNQMVGGVCYVDLFAGDIRGIQSKIPYFKELGLTYLHLMPLYKVPEQSDGGYAVSSYREVNPSLGTMDDLINLAKALRQNGISLALDFVFNHTSDEHEWALRALAGDEDYQEYFWMFPDRTIPDQYEKHLREIFPEQAPGSFTYRREIDRWVWTTFNPFQWDLRYRNPAVFSAMLGEMLFLANIGVEVLRLDAVPFIWKEMGTSCENLPEAHVIIQAFNALVQIAAPAMEFKSEAIVHPDEVEKYFGQGERAGQECTLSYNPTLMALLWEALATRKVTLLQYAMMNRFRIPETCTWVNYVRVHDDIGWSFADEDAQALWVNPFDHRQFLNRFYTGRFEGSFARGLLFNYNPTTKDGRINGTCASLAGLEAAVEAGDHQLIDLAIKRILLLYSVVISVGGIPLIYLGDELATLNDYRYREDENKLDDSRWVHRPFMDWERAAQRHDPQTLEGRVFLPLKRLLEIRRDHPVFSGINTQFIETGNPHVLGYIHWHEMTGVLILANFSEYEQHLEMARFRVYGLKSQVYDLIKQEVVNLGRPYTLQPYQFLWLTAKVEAPQ